MSRQKRHTKKKDLQQKTKLQTQRIVQTPSITLQELETRWASLRVSPPTMSRLKGLLEREGGLMLALAATTALALEQEQEQKISESLLDWVMEEIRLTFLEEGSSHLVESLRFLLDALLAWNLSLGSGWLASCTRPLILLGSLALLLLCGGLLCLALSIRQHRRTH